MTNRYHIPTVAEQQADIDAELGLLEPDSAEAQQLRYVRSHLVEDVPAVAGSEPFLPRADAARRARILRASFKE